MKNIPFSQVELTGGYLFDKQELNRKTTIHAVYDRFLETGRFAAFDFAWKAGDPLRPHWFWDSDVAKWMEGAAYILKKHPAPDLEKIVDETVEKIKKNQLPDGYFNIYHTVVEPEMRWKDRSRHELYCAGHLMEAAVAYAEATGKTDFLSCMEKYADHIYQVFVVDKSASFRTPGHEEIELALFKMYRHTGKKKYLDLAAYFINTRGTAEDGKHSFYTQAHLPVREQTVAQGHAVRALYLYTGMAYLAAETEDEALKNACRTLFEDITTRQMYVSGATGSTHRGEAFTTAFDLPNDSAYAETCASIALMLFGNAMLALENDAKYADAVERALYNGVLSGLSLDGKSFFYENPLEINLAARFDPPFTKKPHYAITQRVECFECSCCPPNLNRILASLGGYVYGTEGDTLFVNQYLSSTLDLEGIACTQKTNYPHNGCVKLQASGVKRIAVRIPAWCEHFTLNKPFVMQNGYAVVENDGTEILLDLDLTPRLVFADPRVWCNAGKACVMRGPVVYCAEGVDNGKHLHSFLLSPTLHCRERVSEAFPLPVLEVECEKLLPFTSGNLYENRPPVREKTTLTLIPYHCFANRGESDMLVWLKLK